MKSVYIYGAGITGKDVYNNVKNTCDVKGYLDSNPVKWGRRNYGIPVIGGADSVHKLEFDEIIVASLAGLETIRATLLNAGVPNEKINTEYANKYVRPRLNFIRDFADIRKNDVTDFAVAEGGVFQGEFAKEINACFPNSTLYLFDTFKGFDVRDIAIENTGGYSESETGHLGIANEEDVISKLPHPEKAIIRKGYFPETAKGLENEKFFFVNLDFDLYQPTLEGLRFFYPRLLFRGVILIHDFFTPGYHGVSQAVYDFEKELRHDLTVLPIGDHCSIAVVKTK